MAAGSVKLRMQSVFDPSSVSGLERKVVESRLTVHHALFAEEGCGNRLGHDHSQ